MCFVHYFLQVRRTFELNLFKFVVYRLFLPGLCYFIVFSTIEVRFGSFDMQLSDIIPEQAKLEESQADCYRRLAEFKIKVVSRPPAPIRILVWGSCFRPMFKYTSAGAEVGHTIL